MVGHERERERERETELRISVGLSVRRFSSTEVAHQR